MRSLQHLLVFCKNIFSSVSAHKNLFRAFFGFRNFYGIFPTPYHFSNGPFLNVFFLNTVFDFALKFLVAILVRNLYKEGHCEGVRSLPRQTKSPWYGPDSVPQCYLSIELKSVSNGPPPGINSDQYLRNFWLYRKESTSSLGSISTRFDSIKPGKTLATFQRTNHVV